MDKKRIIGIIAALLLAFAAFYWLSDLIVYTLVAFLISMLGRPLVKFLHAKLKIPMGLCSVLALIVVFGVLSLIGWIILPLFLKQVNQLAQIDYNQLASSTSVLVQQILAWLSENGINITQAQVNEYVINVVSQIWQKINLESLIGTVTNKLSMLSVALFSTIFISYFFLRDEKMFKKILFLFIPDRYVSRAEKVLASSEHLLSRYFIGISIELLCMMTIISLGLWAFGIDNALLYGCIGGFLNIIPYIGPVIGAVLACLFTLFNNLEFGLSMDLFWLLVKVVGVFVGSNLIDNMILQVTIYSTSVKAHPLEIFFVILIAGNLVGIWGMILAIPCYTVLRIIAKEFFKDTKVVRELTRRI